jgi:hypothetical protein
LELEFEKTCPTNFSFALESPLAKNIMVFLNIFDEPAKKTQWHGHTYVEIVRNEL